MSNSPVLVFVVVFLNIFVACVYDLSVHSGCDSMSFQYMHVSQY